MSAHSHFKNEDTDIYRRSVKCLSLAQRGIGELTEVARAQRESGFYSECNLFSHYSHKKTYQRKQT